MELAKLIHSFYKQGLGEHLVLHLNKEKVILSNITYKNGKLAFKNKIYLSDFLPA